MSNIWLAFITGLTSGGISCFAVQGGLLTSTIATEEENLTKKYKVNVLLSFLISKLIAYTLLGFLLGFLGANLNISTKFQGVLQILIGLFMLATAARLFNIHPIFRYFVITPPKFVLKLLRDRSQAKSFFTPIVLGFLTVLIPCGVTQAMMLLAIGTSSPIWGASIMFAFTLGTTPIFFLLGLAMTELFKKKAFGFIAAGVILILGIISINSGQVLRGSVHTLQNYWSALTGGPLVTSQTQIIDGKQEVTIEVANNGYKTNVNTLKIGVPVRLKLVTKNIRSCARAFTIPDLNIFKVVPVTGTEVIEFTPNKLGQLVYTCSMGMYSGSFNIIE